MTDSDILRLFRERDQRLDALEKELARHEAPKGHLCQSCALFSQEGGKCSIWIGTGQSRGRAITFASSPQCDDWADAPSHGKVT